MGPTYRRFFAKAKYTSLREAARPYQNKNGADVQY